MGQTAQELQVPINLRVNNLQAIMNELQNSLSNLKIGSKGFKDVESIISHIHNEMDKLQVQTSKPFINQRQFVTAERSIDKIEDGLTQAQLVMSRLKFSDLELNPEQTAQLKELNNEILNIRNNIKNVREVTKQNFLGTDIGQSWLGIDPKAVNQSLQQITTAITNAFSKQKKEIDDIEAKMKEYENAVSLKTKITDFTTSLKSINTVKSSKAIFQDTYDKIFNAQGKFQEGGKNIMARWLSDQFSINEDQIMPLIGDTASKVIASLKGGALQNLLLQKLGTLQQSSSSTYGAELKQQLDEARNLLSTLTPIYNAVQSGQLSTADSTKTLEAALQKANQQLDDYKQRQAQAAGSNASFNNAVQQGKTYLEQFRTQLQQTENNFLALERTQRNFQSIKMLITNFMGFTQVMSLVKRGVRDALNHIKELDSVMNKIAIVTDLSNKDLWQQIDAYSDMAQKYGVSIKGAYEVSQIYYQQGLAANDVLTLTNETLKLSKISGLDYAQTTDYMTTALRGFKMEMSEAATIVDVYSNLAAHTAVSQEELAIAMSKTASSLESVGASFQESSAMISTMVAVTRESATNIGSAMKSIAARYGEMKKDPTAVSDIEGEAVAYNKVDSALQSVGISLKDSMGQFRNFTDVIIELGEKWDQLESTQQRYIATQFAGNRQQSRFLALISNVDLLKSNLQYAEDSEDVGDIQALKALDSIETKLEQVKVAYQEMYTTIGAEDIWKGVLDGTKNFMNTLNGLPKLFGTIPIGAVAMIADLVKVIKDVGFMALNGISKVWANIIPNQFGAEQGQQIGAEIAKGLIESLKEARAALVAAGSEAANAAAEGAKQSAQDLNQPLGKEQQVNQSAVVKTTQVISENEVAKMSTVAGAGTTLASSTKTAAENAKEISESFNEVSEKVADASNTISSLTNAQNTTKIDSSLQVKSWFTEAFDATDLEADKTTIVASMTTMAAEASDTLKPAMAEVGRDGSISIAQGLLASSGMAEDAARSLAQSIVDTIRHTLNMHSPSPMIIAMFQNGVGEAIALGLEASAAEVTKAAENLGITVSDTLKEAFEKSDKINLSDHFETGTAQQLVDEVGNVRRKNLIREANDVHSDIVRAGFDKNTPTEVFKELDAREKAIQQEMADIRNEQARMHNIAYEKIPVDYVVASHNLGASNVGNIARNWQGQNPNPSVAIRPMRERVWSSFGNNGSGVATFFFPPEYMDPRNGKAYVYPGDAYTPMLDSYGTYPHLEDASNFLQGQPEIDFDLYRELFNAIADATHLQDIKQLRESLQYTANMPFYYGVSDTGNEGEYRATPTQDSKAMKAEQKSFQGLFQYYLKRAGISDFNPVERKPLAEITGGQAFGKALYDTVDMMRKAESEGSPLDKQGKMALLRENLYNSLLNYANIDVPTKFEDKDANYLISEALSKIKFLTENPRYDYAEAKLRTNIGMSEYTGTIMADTPVGIQSIFDATKAGLNPNTIFLSHQGDMTGPLSRQAIYEYMAQNVRGIAFNENGPLVPEEYNNGFNLQQLNDVMNQIQPTSALSNVVSQMLESTEFGPIIANTIAAGLSNIDLSAVDASAEVSKLVDTLAKTFTDASLDNNTGEVIGLNISKSIVAGMMVGISSDLADMTSTNQAGIGQMLSSLLTQNESLNIGTDLAASVTQGIEAANGPASAAAGNLGSSILEALRTALNMHSPSPTIIAMFENGVGEAIAIGLDASESTVMEVAQKLGFAVFESLRGGIDQSKPINLSDYLNTEEQQTFFNAALKREQQKNNAIRDHYRLEMDNARKGNNRDDINYYNRQFHEATEKRDYLEFLSKRIQKIKYEGVPANILTAAHNFDPEYLKAMAQFGEGETYRPSVAVRSAYDTPWTKFSGATLYAPYQYVDPQQGLADLYRGDAYTPTVEGNPQTYDELKASIDSQKATSTPANYLKEYVRDISRVFNLPQAMQVLDRVMKTPFGKEVHGTIYRDSLSESSLEKENRQELEDAFNSYMMKSAIGGQLVQHISTGIAGMPDFSSILSDFTYNVKEKSGLGASLQHAVEAIYKAEAGGAVRTDDLEKQQIRESLTTTLLKKSGYEVKTGFNDAESETLINTALKYIHFLEQNPQYDYMEAKLRGALPMRQWAGLNLPYDDLESFDGLSAAFSHGMDPRRTFFYSYDNNSPMNKEIIDKYMIQNIPGIAFNENGPIIKGDVGEILNLDELRSALSAESLHLPPVKIDAMIDISKSIMNSDVGQVYANTLKAALANIDFSADNADLMADQVIGYMIPQMYAAIPELHDCSVETAYEVVNGLALGLSSNLASATSAAEGAGKAVIAALNSGAGVASPSVYAIQSGKFIVLGLADGMEDVGPALTAAKALGKVVTTQLDTSLNDSNFLTQFKNHMTAEIDAAFDAGGISKKQQKEYLALVNNQTLADVPALKNLQAILPTDKNGQVTLEGMQAFISGGTIPTNSQVAKKTVELDTTQAEAANEKLVKKIQKAAKKPVELDTTKANAETDKIAEKAQKSVKATSEKEDIHTIEEKIAVLEKLRAAQEAAKGAAKDSDEYKARTAALSDARSITGMNLSWNSDTSKIIDNLKEQAVQADMQKVISAYNSKDIMFKLLPTDDAQLRQAALQSINPELRYESLKRLALEKDSSFVASNAPLLPVQPNLNMAKESGEQVAEVAQAAVDEKPVEVKTKTDEQPNKDELELKSVEQQIAVLDRLKAAREAVNNAPKKSDEYYKAIEERNAAVLEARQTFKNIRQTDIQDKSASAAENKLYSSLKTREIELRAVLNIPSAEQAGDQASKQAQTQTDEQPVIIQTKLAPYEKEIDEAQAQLKAYRDKYQLDYDMDIAIPLKGGKTISMDQYLAEEAALQGIIDKLKEKQSLEQQYSQAYEALTALRSRNLDYDLGVAYTSDKNNPQPISIEEYKAQEAALQGVIDKLLEKYQLEHGKFPSARGYVPPVLTNTDKNVWTTGEDGTVQTKESLSQLLDEVGKVMPAVALAKNALLELFEIKPPADFVAEYNKLTGAGEVQDHYTAQRQEVNALIDELVKLKEISESEGAKLKLVADNSSIYQLIQDIQTYKEIIEQVKQEADSQIKSPVPTLLDPTQVAQFQALIDSLVRFKLLSTDVGSKLKEEFAQATPEQLTAKIKELEQALGQVQDTSNKTSGALSKINFGTIGSAIRMLGNISGLSTQAKGAVTALGGAFTLLGVLISAVNAKTKGLAMSNPWMAIAMGVMGLINGISQLWETQEEKIERLKKEAEELSNKAKEFKSNYKTLDNGIKKINELTEKRHESTEAEQEYLNAANELGEKFPELVIGFDEAGNAIIDVTNSEEVLINARKEAADAAYNAAEAELKKVKTEKQAKLQEARKQLGESNNLVQNAKGKQTEGAQEYSSSFESRGQQQKELSSAISELFSQDVKNGSSNQSLLEEISALNTSMDIENEESYKSTIDNMKFQLQNLKGLDTTKINNLLDQQTDIVEIPNTTIDYLQLIQQKLLELQKEDLSDDRANTLINELNELFIQKAAYQDNLDEEGQTKLKEAEDNFKEFKTAAKDYNTLTATEKGYSRTLITRWQQAQQDTDKFWEYLNESSSAAQVVTSAIYKEFSSWGGEFELDDANINIAANQSKARQIMEDFWTQLSKDDKDLFDQMIGDPKQYSLRELTAKFGSVEGFDQLSDLLESYYQTSLNSMNERLTKNLEIKLTQYDNEVKERVDKYSPEITSDFKTNFTNAISQAQTQQDETLLNTVLKRYTSLLDNGYIQDANLYGESVLGDNGLWARLMDMPYEARNSVYALMEKYGIDTIENIDSMIASLKNDKNKDNDTVIKSLEEIKNTLHSNLALAIQTIISNFTESWSDTQKEASKLSSGVDINEVEKIVNSEAGKASKLSVDDFITSGDKLILTNRKLDLYLNNVIKTQKKQFDEYSAKLTTYIDKWSKQSINYNDSQFIGEDSLKELEAVMGGEGSMQKYMTITKEDGTKEMVNYIVKYDEFWADFQERQKQIAEDINNGDAYFDWATDNLNKSNEWKHGNYSSLAEIYAQHNNKDYLKRLKELAGGAKYEDWELEYPDIQKAVESLTSGYNALINDIVEKDIEDINVKQYEGINHFSANSIIQQYIDGTIDKTKLIENIAALGGKDIKETQKIIDQLVDEYTSNASKAGSLVTQGTTSKTEISAFKLAYKELMGTDAEFTFDPIIQAWTIDATTLRGYLEIAATKLDLSAEEQKSWVDEQIKTLTVDNLDFSKFLSGSASQKDQKILQRDLENYYKTHTSEYIHSTGIQSLKDWAVSRAQSDLAALSEGGEKALNILKSIKGELTTDEIEAAYRAQVEPIKSVYDSIDKLQAGSIVAKNQIDILTRAGFKVSADGVITTAGKLVDAYRSLYQQMAATGEATIAELNSVAGSYLDNRDNEQIAIDAIGQAAGMTYSELAQIYTQAGRLLTEEMVDEMEESTGILKSLGGNKVMIQDFEAFASEMEWSADSEEYITAYKAYNDSMIQYRRHISDEIKDELNNLVEAKPGEEVNLQRMVSTYGEEAVQKVLQGYAVTLNDGILTLENSVVLSDVVKSLGDLVVANGDMMSTELLTIMNQFSASIAQAYQSIVENYESISQDDIQTLADNFGIGYQELVDAYHITDNGNGTYKVNINNLRQLIEDGKEQVGETTYNALLDTMASTTDNVLAAISTASGYVSEGTTSIASMQSFTTELNKLTGGNKEVSELFSYDTVLNTFKLNARAFKVYTDQLRFKLKTLGLSGKAINDYIDSQTKDLMKENLNFTDFLDAIGTSKQEDETQKLKSAWEDISALTGTKLNENWLNILAQGGQAAVDLAIQMKGADNLSTEELEAIYNVQAQRARDAAEELTKGLGETVSGTAVAIMKAANYELDMLDDGSGVITAVGDMVAAYNLLYEAMKSNGVSTQADLNNVYAQLLTANDQTRIDTLDTLSNAGEMTYEAFAELLTKYNKDFEAFLTHGDFYGIESTGFGNIRITDFNRFAYRMEWDINSPEYAQAYSDWVDSMVELQNRPMTYMQNAADSLSTILEAKPGQAINVSYLDKELGGALGAIVKDYGAQVTNGILTLSDTVDIPGLVQAAAQAAAEAGMLIPEQLAELVDKIAETLSQITSFITGGIDGNLTNVQAQQLSTWAKQNGIDSLDFVQTRDGLQLATNSAQELYNVIKDIDSIQGAIVFDKLKEAAIATKDGFKSATTNAVQIKNVADDIVKVNEEDERFAKARAEYAKASAGGKAPSISAFDKLTGNVNMYNRPWIENADGTHSTVSSVGFGPTLEETGEVRVLMTPIPEWAETEDQVLSDEELTEYFDALMAENPVDVNALLELDAEGLEINGKRISNMIIDIKDAAKMTQAEFDAEAVSLNEWSDAWESTRRHKEAPDNSERLAALEEELELANEINMARSTSEDSSFNFMDQNIPAAQNNPLNYWESWNKAFDAINTSLKGSKDERGFMAYQDFYNLVTELGNISKLSGEAVSIGEGIEVDSENFADVINQAAQHLEVTSDGSLKVNLEGFGVDFAGGAEGMAKDVDAGIKAMAQSQIDMLDGLISLLETIVAMEALSDIDVEGDGIDIGNILSVNYDKEGNASYDYKPAYDAWRQDMLSKLNDYLEKGDQSDYVDLGKAIQGIKFTTSSGSKTFEDMLKMSPGDLANMSESFQTAYTSFLDAMVKASLSDNYDLDNIYDSVKDVLSQSGLDDITIDMGDKTFHFGGGVVSVIDWTDQEMVNSVTKALDTWEASHEDYFKNLGANPSVQDKINAISAKLSEGGLLVEDEIELNYIYNIATGKVKIKQTNKKGENEEWTGTYNGKSFKVGSEDAAKKVIAQAAQTEKEGFNVSITQQGTVTGSMSIGSTSIVLSYDENGVKQYTALGTTFDNINDAIAYCVSQGQGDESMSGQRYTVSGQTYEVVYDSNLNLTYSLNLSTGQLEYKGRTFKDKSALIDYIQNIEPLFSDKNWKSQKTKTQEIIKNDTAIIIRDIATGETIYRADGIDFPSSQAFMDYLAAKDQEEGTNGSITNVYGGKIIEYALMGQHVRLTVSSEGDLHYEVTIDGYTYNASSEAGIKQAIADHNYLLGGSANDSASGDVSYTVQKGTVSATVTYSNGEVTVEGADVFEGKANAEVQKELNEKVDTVSATVSSVTVDASAAETTVNLPETITDDQTRTIQPASIKIDTTNLDVDSAGKQIVEALQTYLNNNPLKPTIGTGESSDSGGSTETPNVSGVTGLFDEIAQSISQISTTNPFTDIIKSLTSITNEQIENIKTSADNINAGPAENAKNAINEISSTNAVMAKTAINGIKPKIDTVTKSGTLRVRVSASKAKGNIGALATGNIALASGTQTLMGELGPELVVSHGQYFLVGQSGAEFVDLDKDAIVFNHKQTERLLAQGGIGSRGIPFTNEQNAISYAKGNVFGPARAKEEGAGGGGGKTDITIKDVSWSNGSKEKDFEMAKFSLGPAKVKGFGPAMASASAALAALKQLRSMWQSLVGASVKDLASKGGGGGGGGDDDIANFLKDLEKWYNWLQEIARLEKDINTEAEKRNKLQSDFNTLTSGREYVDSQIKTLDDLQSKLAYQTSLNNDQLDYFNKRRKDFENEDYAFNSLYDFDEYGQLRYKPGALAILSDLTGSDAKTGKANYTAKEQYDKLVAMNSKFADVMQYDSSGNEIEWYDDNGRIREDAYSEALSTFWDKIDADKSEMQSLYDSIKDGESEIYKLEKERNEIIQEIEDNQISVENSVLDALVDLKERQIQDQKDTKDAIEKSAQAVVDGLNKQLELERQQYEDEQSLNDLTKLQNKLAILQRSGGSATEIASLEEQINDKTKDIYFTEQERQIQAIEDASDNEIEKLEQQIQIQEEVLEYQKAHGLLWNEVKDILDNKTPQQIADYIQTNNSKFWTESPTEKIKTDREQMLQLAKWDEFKTTVKDGIDGLIQAYNDAAVAALAQNISANEGVASGDTKEDKSSTHPGQWKSNENGRWWQWNEKGANGETQWSTGWDKINGQWHYFNDEGYEQKGWIKWNDNWYYTNSTTGALQTGIIDVGEDSYYLDPNNNGALFSGGWFQVGDNWFYANADGTLKKNSWQGNYYLGDSGKMLTNTTAEWTDGDKTYYGTLDSTGKWMGDMKLKTYDYGGMVDEDNLAFIHANEAVLTPEQTRILRNDLLGRNSNSLMNLLLDFRHAYSNIPNTITTSNSSNMIVFERAEVNMNIEKINDDYDAQRAGEQALDKMLQIARRSQASNRIGG